MAINWKNKFKRLIHPIIISLISSIFFVSSYPILKHQFITYEVGAKYYLGDSILGNTLGHMTQYLIQTRFDESIPKDDIRFEEA